MCTVHVHIALSGSHRPPRDSLQDDDCHGPHVHRCVESHDPVGDGAQHLWGCVGQCRRLHFVGTAFCQTPGIYRRKLTGRAIKYPTEKKTHN